MVLDDLYQDILMDHYRNPRNKGKMHDADLEVHAKNPFCGDEVELDIKWDGDRIADIHFVGQGCVISQASVSLLTDHVKGKSLDEIDAVIDEFSAMIKGELEKIDEEKLDELCALQGVSKFPTRIKCALLAWNTLKKVVHEKKAALELQD